jgi:hypothetical protein
MSLVDSDHTQPTRRRHNVHYFVKANANGVLKPAMQMFYHELSNGSFGECGHFINDAFPNPKSSVKSFAYCPTCKKTVELQR